MAYWWSFFGSLTSFFFRNRLPEYSDADYDGILFPKEINQCKQEQTTKSENSEAVGYEGERRIGTITTLQADYGLIDQKYYFNLDDLSDRNADIGQVVRYFAYRTNPNSDWRVKQVSIIPSDEWDTGFTEKTSRVISQSTVIHKSITAQVKKRDGRNVLFSGDIRCNLDKISAAFSPVEGDWVELEVDIELVGREGNIPIERVVEVQMLQAVRPKTYHGKISHLSRDENEIIGIINSEVYFRGNVCEPTYKPAVNDDVLAKVIESDQGALTSRAIFIIPVVGANVTSSLLSTIEEERLFDSKHGISVNAECNNKRLKLGSKTLFNITVENVGTEEQTLIGGNLVKLKKFMRITTPLEKSVRIAPCATFLMTVEATAVGPGFFTDILILNFAGEWQIGCLLDFYVDVEREGSIFQRDAASSKPSIKFEKRNEALKKVATKIGFQSIVPGRRPIKPASFLPVKLENYLIPNSIKDIYVGKNGICRKVTDIESDLEKLYPCLNEELNEVNYKPKFHTLLHMEDIEGEIAIKKYDKERGCFHRKGDYLELEIENLAESRPSLAIGDKLLASDPAVFGKSGNGMKYEGFIHKIRANSILLKFNESFHTAYDGKDYTVEFFRSRGPIRRCHQAINVIAEKMSTKWLFPDSLAKLKPTQVNIVGEFPAKQEEKIHACTAKVKVNTATKNLSSKSLNIMKEIEVNSEKVNEKKEEKETLQPQISKQQIPHEYCQVRDSSGNVAIQWEGEKSKAGRVNPDPPKSRASTIKRRDVIIKWVNSNLNHYQKEAVRNILKGEARPLPYVIFGPPGTGKTITAVETVLQITHLMPESRILIATPSNSSADLICERLLSWNLNLLTPGKLVRLIGYNHMLEGRISPSLQPYVTCIDMKTSGAEDVSYDENGYKHSSRESIGRSRITVGTCVTVGVLYTLGFPKGHFTHIIVDEAGQAMEPEILIPLAFMNEDSHVILAGDPRQLGPVILSNSAKVYGLGESLLSRFLMRFPYQRDPESYPETDGYDPRLVTKLLYNYRSLPDILYMYNTLFYDSSLISQICNVCSPEAALLETLKKELVDNPWETLSGVIFYGVRGINRQDDDSPSWYNEHEIFQVSKYIAALYKAGVKHTEIGIITPYQKQVMKLREHLRAFGFELPKIGTVEEFQGQERPVIIVSTVRSDEGLLTKDRKYALGFVASQQRLNVAISRARTMLIIVGNPHLLVKDIAWRNLLRLCIERKCYFGTDLPNSLLRDQIPA